MSAQTNVRTDLPTNDQHIARDWPTILVFWGTVTVLTIGTMGLLYLGSLHGL